MLRLFDLVLSALGLLVAIPLLLILTIAGWFDTGSPLFRQTRVGRHKQPFTLVKFRTMKPETAHVATHLADASAVTRFGGFLRRTKLDELPQLWNVLKGEMSLVGPRPCLFNQDELIRVRERLGAFAARRGITGLAQVNEIDMLNRVFDGFEGKLTTGKWAKISKCSPDTALRDINELVSRGVLRKEASGGRSTSYLLCEVHN
jgi:O-antigen biosynthesis protein WbqP